LISSIEEEEREKDHQTSGRTYLPRLTASPRMKEDMMIVKIIVSGIDMVRNTGPLFAIVQNCM
jgi:hypothetical protein